MLRRYFAYIARQMAKNLTWGTDDCALPMTPPRLVALIRHAMPEDGIVCLDNGLYKVSAQAAKIRRTILTEGDQTCVFHHQTSLWATSYSSHA